MEQYGDNYLAVSAARSIMPVYCFVFHFHANSIRQEYGSINGVDNYIRQEYGSINGVDNYIRQEYGSINGVDNFLRAVAKINAYNENHGKISAKIEQTANGETCLAICDNFNERFHENLPQAGDLVLVDATSTLDRQDTKHFHIMIPSAIDALPLGTLISTRELYKSLLPKNAFLAEVVIWDQN